MSTAGLELSQRLHGILQLRVDVDPFAHAQVGKEIGFAKLAHLSLLLQGLELRVVGVPNVQQRQEVRSGVDKPAMRQVRRFLSVHGALSWILNAQTRRNHQDF